MVDTPFTWQSHVRDYELDSQGIINNAVYVNYFEQCRNDYARSINIDFIELYQQGFSLCVSRLNIKYLLPLRAGQAFMVTAEISAFDNHRIYFYQQIREQDTHRFVAKADVVIACVDHKTKKACMPDALRKNLPEKKFLAHQPHKKKEP